MYKVLIKISTTKSGGRPRNEVARLVDQFPHQGSTPRLSRCDKYLPKQITMSVRPAEHTSGHFGNAILIPFSSDEEGTRSPF